MQRENKRKLALNRETIRALTTQEMAGVAGGKPAPTETEHTCGACSNACKISAKCPNSNGTCCACTHHCNILL